MHAIPMKNRKAFSLIELLIVLVIIGIIAAIAYPNYTSHLIKTRRAQAKVNLLDLAAKLEQYYVIHNSYQGVTLADLNFQQDDKLYHYQLQTNEDTFLISAVPLKTQIKDICGTLSYNEKGEKENSGKANDNCW